VESEVQKLELMHFNPSPQVIRHFLLPKIYSLLSPPPHYMQIKLPQKASYT
jgi:hypothetical protein